jgi:hypothetical protein
VQLVFARRTVVRLPPVYAHPSLNAVVPSISSALMRSVPHLNTRSLHPSLLVFSLLGILQNVGGHPIQ